MPPISSLLPTLPWGTLEILMNVVAGLGAVLITYAIFLEAERNQDAVFLVGSACLLVYAVWIGNTIFAIAFSGLALASFIELVEILFGMAPHKIKDDKNDSHLKN